MHFTIGIRFPAEVQAAGLDMHGHGEGWPARVLSSDNGAITENGTVATVDKSSTQVSPSTNVIIPETDDLGTLDRPNARKASKRQSVRDILQDAFT